MNETTDKLKELLENDKKIIEENYKEIERLNNIIKDSINYIKWHYDLGTKGNVEFCILRDRLLSILKGVELTENDKKQVKWLKEEFKVGVDKE